jgi:ABC-2 type transport system ATP-binding protein
MGGSVSLAFGGHPEVLILDEPAAGLDPIARRELLDQIVETLAGSDGCTVLLSTHLVGDLGRVADYIGIMDSGRMAMSLPLETLLDQIKRVQAIFPADQPSIACVIPGALFMARTGPVVNAIVRWTHDGELESLRASVAARIEVFPMELEDIFIELFGDRAPQSHPAQLQRELKNRG